MTTEQLNADSVFIKLQDLHILGMQSDKGVHIHAMDDDNWKLLYFALMSEDWEAVPLLLKKGALVGEKLDSFLITTIFQKNHNILKMLIDHGVQNNQKIDFEFLCHLIMYQGNQPMIEIIMPHCRFLKLYIPKFIMCATDLRSRNCLELLLKWNFTVNPNDYHDEDFIYAAVMSGYLQIVSQLIDFGIDVDMVNSKTGLNLLTVACLHEYYEIVEKLLEHNANVNVKISSMNEVLRTDIRFRIAMHELKSFFSLDLIDVTCLHIAVFNSDSETTDILLKYGAKVKDAELLILWGYAVHNNCEEIVRVFLEHGVKVADINSNGKGLLHLCVHPDSQSDYSYNIVKLLLENGANIHLKTSKNTLVFDAINNGHRKIAQLFLDWNADVQYISPGGDTSLYKAIEREFDVKFIKTLLKMNLSVHTKNARARTPLHVACMSFYTEQSKIIEALLSQNADINCTDRYLRTPLHLACNHSNLEAVKVLLKNGANPHIKNKEGKTPLHYACGNDENVALEVVQLLLNCGANIDAVDLKGRTPLYTACATSNDRVVKYLLDLHANLYHTDFKNSTPLHFTLQYYTNVVDVLFDYNDVNFIYNDGQSIVHYFDEKKLRVIKIFASTDVDFNSLDKEGNTPLHIAVKKLSEKMIESLIKYGTDINILNGRNKTPLEEAVEMTYPLDGSDRSLYLQRLKQIKIKLLTRQVIKLKVAGLKVHHQNLNIIYDSENGNLIPKKSLNNEDITLDVQQLELECEREIEMMKSLKIGIDNFTFYDLLTENIHFLSRYVGIQNIEQILNSEDYDKQFSLYMDIIRSRVREASIRRKRYKLMDSARNEFILKISKRLPDECIDMVLDYLDNKELEMFTRATESLKVTQPLRRSIRIKLRLSSNKNV